jgi:hypothetical protein
MKLTKDMFTTWERVGDEDYNKDFDDELIITIQQDQTNLDVADYILQLQDDVEWHVKQAKISNERIVKYRTRITQLESYHMAVRLTCEHCDDCKCFKND